MVDLLAGTKFSLATRIPPRDPEETTKRSAMNSSVVAPGLCLCHVMISSVTLPLPNARQTSGFPKTAGTRRAPSSAFESFEPSEIEWLRARSDSVVIVEGTCEVYRTYFSPVKKNGI